MNQSTHAIEKQFFQYINKIQHYEEALALIGWDLRTGAPIKGVEQRSEVIGSLSEVVFNMTLSDELKGYIDVLSDESVQKELSEITKRSVEVCKKRYEQNINIPANEYKDYIILQSKAENVWEEAKKNDDFSMLQPYLEKIVTFKKRMAEYWGHEKNKYNALLDLYEPGVTVKTLDRVFGQLRDHIVPLVQEIGATAQPDASFLNTYFSKQQQRDFSVWMLKEIGYDFSAGRLDETAHPFQTSINPDDVRVTTHYDEHDFRQAIFGTIHEGGHALYEQNISRKLIGTPLCEGTSMGIHESQSLFFENFIARSHSFWEHYYPSFQKAANRAFDHIDLETFYRATNMSEPSFIRIHADELTYPLHIIVRYEIEKALFDDQLLVKDLPGIWNDKMESYLGIRPERDSKGVLQDIHWPGGDFGYFPSYALGYVYAAQLKHAMLKELPDFDDLLRQGNMTPIRHWLSEHIHQYGSLKRPMDIVKDVTGEGLNAQYLIDYLNTKYRGIYNLHSSII